MAHAGGRPKIFDNINEYEEAIDLYFENNWTEEKPPTITGLALHLGFASKFSLYDYKDRNDEFSQPTKRALTLCENWVEMKGMMGKIPPSVAQFILKNHGWKDKTEVENTNIYKKADDWSDIFDGISDDEGIQDE